RVAPEGDIDLPAFHREQGRKYLTAWAIFSAVGLAYNAAYDLASHGSYFLRQDIVVLPMTLVAVVAAIFVRRPRIQAACLAVEFGAWAVFFARFQGSLTG
ncbi:MAG TPA: hypothetical protein VGH86_09595, partial [Phenylobacterium sp.]